jgi:hypothetical protein
MNPGIDEYDDRSADNSINRCSNILINELFWGCSVMLLSGG